MAPVPVNPVLRPELTPLGDDAPSPLVGQTHQPPHGAVEGRFEPLVAHYAACTGPRGNSCTGRCVGSQDFDENRCNRQSATSRVRICYPWPRAAAGCLALSEAGSMLYRGGAAS